MKIIIALNKFRLFVRTCEIFSLLFTLSEIIRVIKLIRYIFRVFISKYSDFYL